MIVCFVDLYEYCLGQTFFDVYYIVTRYVLLNIMYSKLISRQCWSGVALHRQPRRLSERRNTVKPECIRLFVLIAYVHSSADFLHFVEQNLLGRRQ